MVRYVSVYDGQFLYEIAWNSDQGIMFIIKRVPFGINGRAMVMEIDIPGTHTLPKFISMV